MTTKTIYSGMSARKFRVYAIVSCFIGDILIGIFLWNKYTDKESFNRAFEKVKYLYDIKETTPGLQDEIYMLLAQAIIVFVALIIAFHMFVYGLYYLNKRFVYFYIKCLVWVGVPGCLMVGVTGIFDGLFSQAILTFQAALYLYVLLGLKYFPHTPKEQS